MHRLLGTLCAALVLSLVFGSSAVFAYDSPQKYGVELRGGGGVYDMGDISFSFDAMKSVYRPKVSETLKDTGPMGGFSFLYRPSKHTMWEVGINAIMDVENRVEHDKDTAGQILMHANEFFFKGNLVITPMNRLHINLGTGISYYNTELQVQDKLAGKYYYDAVGRSWGLVGGAGVEFLVSERVGLCLMGGGRLTNSNHFSYADQSQTRQELPLIRGGGRNMEVNLSGAFATLGFRFYFDQVTKPVDFTR